MFSRKLFAIFFFACVASAQVTQFPFTENFDTVTAPSLPHGWLTTTNRSSTGDFTTTTATVFSSPNAVAGTNSTIPQSLVSPILDFSNKEADSLIFYERRSSSHNSGLLVEASIDGGTTFSIQVGDTLANPGTTSFTSRRLKLPDVLDKKPSVRIRWRMVGNGTGKSGTIRFDDIAISVISSFDAGISAVRLSPTFPAVGDSVLISATVKNFGLEVIHNIPVECYQDFNGDSIPQPNELLAAKNVVQQLLPNDTQLVQIGLYDIGYGKKIFIVKTNYANDENSENDTRLVLLSVGLHTHSVVINEIMYSPINEPEWIELFNPSSIDIDLRNWMLSNRNTQSQYAITGIPTLLAAHGFAVITKDTAFLRSVHPTIPSLLIQSSSLPTYLFGNSGDAVVVFDERGAVMDSVHYSPSWGGSAGTSIERIEWNQASNDSTHWGSSDDSTGSTPGKLNSRTPAEYDLRILRVSAEIGNGSAILVIVQNVGRLPALNYSVSVFAHADSGSIPQDSELLERKSSVSQLQAGDSATFSFMWNNPIPGRKLLIARVDFSLDSRLQNNTSVDTLKIGFPPNSILVNEIMYQPFPGQSEYVELYNRTSDSLDLCGWTISDMRDKAGHSNEYPIAKSTLEIKPGEYFVLAADSSLLNFSPNLQESNTHICILNKGSLSLNDNGDDVIVRDLTGQIIDSVRYSAHWHNPNLTDVTGRALERVNPNLSSNDPRNWSSCANTTGGTPGKRNSIYTAAVPGSASLACSPNPFSPDGDGFEDFTMITFELPTTAGLVRIRIFDSKGRLTRTLANGEPSGAHGQILWDGFTDGREKARMGIYIVLLEALDSNGNTVQALKGVVVLATKL